MVGPQRGIHGVEDEVIGFVASIRRAEIPCHQPLRPLDPRQKGAVIHKRAKSGREAAGEKFLEGEPIGIVENTL